MKLLPLALLALLVLAGCAANKPIVTTSTSEAPAPAPFTQVIARISPSSGGGEPSLGVTPNGTLFTDLFSHVWRRTANGTPCTDMVNSNPGLPNTDPHLAAHGDGTV